MLPLPIWVALPSLVNPVLYGRGEGGSWAMNCHSLPDLSFCFFFFLKTKYFYIFSGCKSTHSDCRKHRENIKNKIKIPQNITIITFWYFSIYSLFSENPKYKYLMKFHCMYICDFYYNIGTMFYIQFCMLFLFTWHYEVAEAAVFKYALVM